MQKDYSQQMATIAITGFTYSVGNIIEESWEIVKKNLGMFIVYTLLYFVVAGATSFVPHVGPFVNIVITPALVAGFVIAARKVDENEAIDISTVFEGFALLPKLLPMYLISVVFTLIGAVLLILPGVYLAICYLLVVPLLVFHNGSLGIIDTLELLRKAITKNWWLVFATLLVLGLINLVGLIPCGLGLFFTVPITFVAYYVLFKNIFGLPEAGGKDQEFHELLND